MLFSSVSTSKSHWNFSVFFSSFVHLYRHYIWFLGHENTSRLDVSLQQNDSDSRFWPHCCTNRAETEISEWVTDTREDSERGVSRFFFILRGYKWYAGTETAVLSCPLVRIDNFLRYWWKIGLRAFFNKENRVNLCLFLFLKGLCGGGTICFQSPHLILD